MLMQLLRMRELVWGEAMRRRRKLILKLSLVGGLGVEVGIGWVAARILRVLGMLLLLMVLLLLLQSKRLGLSCLSRLSLRLSVLLLLMELGGREVSLLRGRIMRGAVGQPGVSVHVWCGLLAIVRRIIGNGSMEAQSPFSNKARTGS